MQKKNAPGRMKQAKGDAQERQTVRRILDVTRPLGWHFAAGLLLGVQAGEGTSQAQQHFVDVALAHG